MEEGISILFNEEHPSKVVDFESGSIGEHTAQEHKNSFLQTVPVSIGKSAALDLMAWQVGENTLDYDQSSCIILDLLCWF